MCWIYVPMTVGVGLCLCPCSNSYEYFSMFKPLAQSRNLYKLQTMQNQLNCTDSQTAKTENRITCHGQRNNTLQRTFVPSDIGLIAPDNPRSSKVRPKTKTTNMMMERTALASLDQRNGWVSRTHRSVSGEVQAHSFFHRHSHCLYT